MVAVDGTVVAVLVAVGGINVRVAVGRTGEGVVLGSGVNVG